MMVRKATFVIIGLLLLSGCGAMRGSGHYWQPTDRIRGARDAQTADLLPDGRLLMVGGFDGKVMDSAEIYDPASGKWRFTEGLKTGRSHHVEVVLTDGRVLVAGGYGEPEHHLKSCEMYDAFAGTWSSTGALATGRFAHAAVRLLNGKVLVMGGTGPHGNLASAEIYDPDSGMWSSTGSLHQARVFHKATLLPTGNVLVSGGKDDKTALNSAELYDPVAGVWRVVGSLRDSRRDHMSVLLADGRVLVAGGVSHGTYLKSAEIFDPESETWSPTGSLNHPRGLHGGVLLPSGKVLVPGGEYGKKQYLTSVEIFEPGTGIWRYTRELHSSRARYSLNLLRDGSVLIGGGYDGDGVIDGAELFHEAWNDPGTMPSRQGDRQTVQERLVGAWRLVDYSFSGGDGKSVYPFGKDVLGIIQYNHNGTMSAQLMRKGRNAFASGDHFGGSAQENTEAFQGYFAYFGRYEIDEANGRITHHVDGALLPNWVGKDQTRSYTFSGNRLILGTPADTLGEDELIGTFVWEKQAD